MNAKIELKILDNRLYEWGLPAYQTASAAAMDLYAAVGEPTELATGACELISTGMAIYLQDVNLCAMVLPRSGLGHRQGLVLGNGTGLIDADYQGELKISCWNRGTKSILIEAGMRIAQLLIVPIIHIDWQVVSAFTPSARGEQGFGSTG